MVNVLEIERSLRGLLPTTSKARVTALASVLADAANGDLPSDVLQQRLAGDPTLAPLLRELAGRRIVLGQTVLSFEQEDLLERAVGESGAPDISMRVHTGADRRPGVSISGGMVNGVVVGYNEGTINYTEVRVNIQTGTILSPAQRPTIVRLAPTQPPLPVRQFYDRVQPLQEVQLELQPRHCAWLTGPVGCGMTAFLRQAANAAPARRSPTAYCMSTARPSHRS